MVETQRVLEFAAAGEHFGERHGEFDGIGRVAARPAHGILAAFENLQHRIVHARLNGAIVQQESISKAVQARPCVLVAAHDGLFAQIPAGHYKSLQRLVEKQMVQRSVGKHHAQACISGRHAVRDSRVPAARQENNRPAGSLKQNAIRIGEDADTFRHVPRSRHDCEGLSTAALSFAEKAHGALVRGVTDKMEPAQTFDGENRAFAKQGAGAFKDPGNLVRGSKYRRRCSHFFGGEQGRGRPAVRAGVFGAPLWKTTPVAADLHTQPGSGRHMGNSAIVVFARS